MSTRKKKLLSSLAVIGVLLLLNVAFLLSGSDSMSAMLAVQLPLAVSVLGSALYFLYWDPPAVRAGV